MVSTLLANRAASRSKQPVKPSRARWSTLKSSQNRSQGGVGSLPAVPSVLQECRESTEELARSAPGALQEQPGAPQELPEKAQRRPKSGPEQPKVSPRGVQEPFREQKQGFSKIAFSSTRERDFRGSGLPQERPKSTVEGLSGPLSSDFEREKSGTVTREGLSSDSGRQSSQAGRARSCSWSPGGARSFSWAGFVG